MFSLFTRPGHPLLLCTAQILLTACTTIDEHSKQRYLTVGDMVKLTKAVDMPAYFSHINFQQGSILNQRDVNRYATNCYLDTGVLGPYTIEPQSYSVSELYYSDEMYSDTGAVVNYYIDIKLVNNRQDKALQNHASQHRELLLRCQSLDGTMSYYDFPVTEIAETTAGYFSFPD